MTTARKVPGLSLKVITLFGQNLETCASCERIEIKKEFRSLRYIILACASVVINTVGSKKDRQLDPRYSQLNLQFATLQLHIIYVQKQSQAVPIISNSFGFDIKMYFSHDGKIEHTSSMKFQKLFTFTHLPFQLIMNRTNY